MNKFVLVTFSFFSFFTSYAQKIVVPDKINFADQVLVLTPEARKKIQSDVDALTRNESYLKRRIETVDLHLPLIEQAFREENVPDDIKYLVIQESALVGDAVSSANAIGYWQFKEAAAREVGLAINSEVDERMNIVNASLGAARYLKSNNRYFDNWFYAVLAYNVGPGGGLKITDKRQYGKKEMKLDGKTHWYVLKFLAHKIAFEKVVNQNPEGYEKELIAYSKGGGKTLEEIAAEFNLTETDLEPYNKWLKKKRVPEDKTYYVIIPANIKEEQKEVLASVSSKSKVQETDSDIKNRFLKISDFEVKESDLFPIIEEKQARNGANVTVNNIPAIIAKPGETIRKISEKTGIPARKLIKFNDLDRKGAAVKAGNFYYLKHKKNKAKLHFHVVEPGENLWTISQRFGIKEKKLMRDNRMKKEEKLEPGRVLWMRFIRPKDQPVEYKTIPAEKKARQEVALPKTIPVSNTEKPKEKIRPKAELVKVEKQSSNQGVNVTTPKVTLQNAEKSAPEQNESPRVKEDEKSPIVSPVPVFSEPDEPIADKKTAAHSDISDGQKIFHTVGQGETWYSIARRYGLTTTELAAYNNMTTNDILEINQQLQIITGKKNSQIPETGSDFVFHKVQPGETLYGVARQYGVTIKELMSWNDKETFNLSVGEDLKVRKQTQNK